MSIRRKHRDSMSPSSAITLHARWLVSAFALFLFTSHGLAGNSQKTQGNRLTYLDDFANPYYVHRDFPKLTTPQWVGDPEIELVVTLGIDDMRNNTAHYESHLRPILNRLKEIDGRAPLSIMTCEVDPQDPQLQAWLAEGLNIDAHTASHPCPCLQGGDLRRAKGTYDQCVDQIFTIPRNAPTAFRFPCMDSLNTPSPRGFAEILNRTTEKGNFLQLSSSICVLLTPQDPALPRELVYQAPGEERFRKYLPFRNFVNVVHDYPYPFVLGKLLWEFPCAVPDDWQGQHLLGASHPQTARDFQAYAAAVRLKQGTANFVFHPNDWIGNSLMTQTVDAIHRQHGKHVKFLNFRECAEHLQQHLLCGQRLRDQNGDDNGVRLLDVNHDQFLDVVISNSQIRTTRIWQPELHTWREVPFPVPIATKAADGRSIANGVHFGVMQDSGFASFILCNRSEHGIWHFDGQQWQPAVHAWQGLEPHTEAMATVNGIDPGVRLRDVDGDGLCELVISNPTHNLVCEFSTKQQTWSAAPFVVPVPVVDRLGRDNGVRFVDLNADQIADVIASNADGFGVYLYRDKASGWSDVARQGTRDDPHAIPLIAQDGQDFGTWFADDHMWIQNEFTNQLPDGVDKVSYGDLLGERNVGPLDPEAACDSFRLPDGLELELVASEPLVQDPVAIDWGYDGSLWVAEMGDYPLGVDGAGGAGGRIRHLQDRDHDGKLESSTLFLDGLHFPSGLMVWGKGILISAAPDILYAEDTDQDGRADLKKVLFTGFVEGNQQHRVHGFARGLDNWLYLSNGHSGGQIRSVALGQTLEIRGRDLRIDPRTGAMTTVAGETQHSRCQDDAGNWFGGANNSVGWHYVLAEEQLKRNPHAHYPRLWKPLSQEEQVFPSGKRLMHWEGYLAPPLGEPESASAVCGYTFYRDHRLGSEFAGNFFLCDATNNAVQRRILSPQGSTFTSTRSANRHDRDFLTSVDPWFRPVMARTGPDGALWIVDMYRMVIEHPEWISDLLEQEIDVRSGCDRGRIYRITAIGQTLRPIPDLTQLTPQQVATFLGSENAPQREIAQQWLIEFLTGTGDTSLLETLRHRAMHGVSVLERLHALATLDGAGQLDANTLTAGLDDAHAWIRRHAYRLVGKQLQLAGNRTTAAERWGAHLSLRVSQETDPVARIEGAYALGELPGDGGAHALWMLWQQYATDEYLHAALLSSVHRDNLPTLIQLAIRADHPSAIAELLGIALESQLSSVLDQTVAYLEQQLQSNPVTVTHAFPVVAALLDAPTPSVNATAQLIREHEGLFQRCSERARAVLIEGTADLPLRDAALALLGRRDRDLEQDIAAIATHLTTQTPATLQQRAVQRLATLSHPSATNALLQCWNSATPSLRRSIGVALLRQDAATRAWLEAIQAGTLPANSVELLHQQRLLHHTNSELKSLAESIWNMKSAGSRAQVVQEYTAALPRDGDAVHGKQLFAKHCSACHQLDGVGQVVGSNLAELQHKSLAALLESVLDPNRAVEDRFLEYVITTEEGQIFNGILAEETSAAITLRGQDGKQQQILRNHVAELRNLGRSFMPEGFERELRPKEMMDLLRYLQEQRTPPKQVPGNSPTLVQAKSSDLIQLLASQCSIYGQTLVYESGYRNLGFWSSGSDKAVWTLETDQAGNYTVELEFACHVNSSGNHLVFEAGDTKLTAAVPSTGSWDHYEHWQLGTLTLPTGLHSISVYPLQAPQNCLIDLRSIKLTRIPD